jgi:small-conductance mechanosensitive channel
MVTRYLEGRRPAPSPGVSYAVGRIVQYALVVAGTLVCLDTLGVGVAYGSDTQVVRETLLDAALAHPDVLKEPGPLVLFKDFGDSSLNFELAVWLDGPEREPVIMSELRFEIDRVFRERAIEIPFPQRELRLRSEPLAR